MLNTFKRGGVHPDDGKSYARNSAIETPAVPDQVVIPMSQHFGAPCTPTVKVGDLVKKGQLIGTSDAFLHADIHASTSGKVIKIAPMPHNMMVKCMAVVIQADGKDEWLEGLPEEHLHPGGKVAHRRGQGGEGVSAAAGPVPQHLNAGQVEVAGHQQHPFRIRRLSALKKLQRVVDVLPGVAGLILPDDLSPVHPVLHQVVIHGLGLADGLVTALAAGHHNRHVRVSLQIAQGGVLHLQMGPKANREWGIATPPPSAEGLPE